MDTRRMCYLFTGTAAVVMMFTFLLDSHYDNYVNRKLLSVVTGVSNMTEFKATQAKVKADQDILHIAEDKLKAGQDKLSSDQAKLKEHQDRLVEEQAKLKSGQDKLKEDQDTLKVDKDLLMTEQEKLKPKDIAILAETAQHVAPPSSEDDPNRCYSCELIQADPGPLSEEWQQQYRDFIKFMDSLNRDYLAIGGFAMFAMRCGGYALQKDVYHTEPWRGLFGKTDNDLDFVMVAHNETDRERLWETAKTTLTSWKWSCIDWREAGGWGCYPPGTPWYNYHYFFQVYIDESSDGNGAYFRRHKESEKIPKSKVFPTASAKMYNVTVPVARDSVWTYNTIVGRGKTCFDQWFPKKVWHWTDSLTDHLIDCAKCLDKQGYATFYTGDCKNETEVRRMVPKIERFDVDVIGTVEHVYRES